jgi:hypothetical protein
MLVVNDLIGKTVSGVKVVMALGKLEPEQIIHHMSSW